jgi:hypothetical protein
LLKVFIINNTIDDHGKEFVKLCDLKPLLDILQMKNLPIDFPSSQACQCVATLCKFTLVSDNIQQNSLFLIFLISDSSS